MVLGEQHAINHPTPPNHPAQPDTNNNNQKQLTHSSTKNTTSQKRQNNT
jgi:hypothetical protein